MKQTLIVVVGPDMCGKTQIAKEIAKRTGIPYFKAGSEHDAYLSSKVSKRELFLNQLRYADPRVCDLLRQTGQSVIFDRGWPCEFAYSKVMGRETDATMLWHLDQEWADLGTVVVVCYRTSYDGIVDDLDPSIRAATLEHLTKAYLEFADRTKCCVKLLCVDDEDVDREVREVLEFIGLDQGAK